MLQDPKEAEDEESVKEAKAIKSLVRKIVALLPQVFPPDEQESTMVYHDDLHERNILVDDSGAITAVLDWECVSVVRIWHACQPPALLRGRTQDAKPQRNRYGAYQTGVDNGTAEENEGVTSLYWDHMHEYERGQLCSIFIDEMQRLLPEWVEEYHRGEPKRDLELAIQRADAAFSQRQVLDWVEAYKKGERYSLRETLSKSRTVGILEAPL